MSIENKIYLPPAMLKALSRQAFEFTEAKAIFHCLEVGPEHWVGVVGDGDNAAYETFSFKNGVLTASNVGYGDSSEAMRRVLFEVLNQF